MRMTTAALAASKFCVIVHDVTPFFAREIDSIFEHLLPETGNALAGAVVPCWHAVEPDARGRQMMRGWSSLCGETLLHGWTHRREHRPGIVSWATGRADEFGGCAGPDVIERVRRGRLRLQEIVGRTVSGLVPPAWRLPVAIDELRDSGIEYILDFGRLQSTSGHDVPLATFSWDWGRLSVLSRAGAFLGRCLRLWNRRAVPVIVLHPADVWRGHVACAVDVIRRLKSAGGIPVRIGDLMPNANSVLKKGDRHLAVSNSVFGQSDATPPAPPCEGGERWRSERVPVFQKAPDPRVLL